MVIFNIIISQSVIIVDNTGIVTLHKVFISEHEIRLNKIQILDKKSAA